MNKTAFKVIAFGALATVVGLWAVANVTFINNLIYGKKPAQ
jgi:hypothetical protein